jgi:hypothetical protein
MLDYDGWALMRVGRRDCKCVSWGIRRRLSEGVPDERGLGLALGVANVEDQGQVAVVNGDAGDIDDARDALLVVYQRIARECGAVRRGA